MIQTTIEIIYLGRMKASFFPICEPSTGGKYKYTIKQFLIYLVEFQIYISETRDVDSLPKVSVSHEAALYSNKTIANLVSTADPEWPWHCRQHSEFHVSPASLPF